DVGRRRASVGCGDVQADIRRPRHRCSSYLCGRVPRRDSAGDRRGTSYLGLCTARFAHLVIFRQASRRTSVMVRSTAMADRSFALTPGKRVLYLTKDPDRIRRQLAGTLTLRMSELSPDELLDDINTDAMTPAWVCFDFDPKAIAQNAYAGLIVGGQRLFETGALANG